MMLRVKSMNCFCEIDEANDIKIEGYVGTDLIDVIDAATTLKTF